MARPTTPAHITSKPLTMRTTNTMELTPSTVVMSLAEHRDKEVGKTEGKGLSKNLNKRFALL